jgi:hypothetical protein
MRLAGNVMLVGSESGLIRLAGNFLVLQERELI